MNNSNFAALIGGLVEDSGEPEGARLKELPLADIVQLVAVSGKTGMFSLTRAAERGVVYIQNGQITDDFEGYAPHIYVVG